MNALLLALWVAAGCRPATEPVPPAAPEDAGPAQPDASALPTGDLRLEPACKPFIDIEGRIVVGGRPTDLKVDRGEGLPKIRTYGWTDAAVLVALKTDWVATPSARPEGRLSRVDCRTGTRARLYDEANADLGSTVIAQDGRHIYFSGARGLSLLDTYTKQTTLLALAPVYDSLCTAASADPEGHVRDIPQALSRAGDRLVFHRGGPCGAEGDWVAEELELRGPVSGVLGTVPDSTKIRRPHPVATVVGDKSDTLWLGDAGRCNEPGVHDPSTIGAIWRSRDGATSWERVPVADPKTGPMPTPAQSIWTDLTRPGHVLVRNTLCQTSASLRGGSVYRTRDGGATWSQVKIPRIIEPADIGQNVLGVLPKEGDLDRLFLWTAQGIFRTRNGGETWFPVADDADDHPGPTPPDPPKYAQIGGYIFRATPDGLVRRERATRRIDRLFPP